LLLFNDRATTDIYTLSLHDALPIYPQQVLLVLAPEIAPGLDPFLGSEVLNLVHSSRDFKTLNEIHRFPECDYVYLIDLDHDVLRSEEHTSELQSRENLVCRLLLEKK